MTISYQFTLDKNYLEECFDESLPHSPHQSPKYGFAGSFIGIGMGLIIFTDMGGVAPYIMVGLGVLEFISFYYRRPWWLARQMWSRASNSTVTITMNDDGIESKNPYTESLLEWDQIKQIIHTPKGMIFVNYKGQQTYLSKAFMPAETERFIEEHLAVYQVDIIQ